MAAVANGSLVLQRRQHLVDHDALIAGVAERIGKILGQRRSRRRHRHLHDAEPLTGRESDPHLARSLNGPITAKRLVIFGELTHRERRLLRIAAGVEFHELDRLAADAALGIDFIDREIDRDLVGVGEADIRPGLGHREPKNEILGMCAAGHHLPRDRESETSTSAPSGKTCFAS